MAPSYLITSASGHIGQRLVPLLISHPSKPTLVLPTTNAERLTSSLPPDFDSTRVHVLEGSVQDPGFIDSALKDYKVTGVFLCLTGSDELFTTFNLFDSLRRSGTVKHLVYLSAAGDYSLEAQQSGLLAPIYSAHVAVKCILEAKIKHGLLPRDQEGGLSWTILGPTLFFDNDLINQHNMLLQDGSYAQPLGSKGVSRVSEDDIALAVVNALQDDGKQWHGKKIMLGSLQTYTAEKTARLWSQALGKEIKPTMSDQASLYAYEQDMKGIMGPAWARDLKLMFELFEAGPFGMSEDQYKEQVTLLGKEPERYEKYVEASAKKLKGQ